MEKNWIKTKIGVGSVVKAKIGGMEENKREGRSGRTRKDVMGCVQDMVENNKFLFQFENGHKKEMFLCLLVYICLKEEVCLEIYDPISNLPEKQQAGFLTIYGDPDIEEPCIF